MNVRLNILKVKALVLSKQQQTDLVPFETAGVYDLPSSGNETEQIRERDECSLQSLLLAV